MSVTKRVMFAPAPVAGRFRAEYSTAMALRPSQIRATCVDGALVVPIHDEPARSLRELSLPVTIMAGDGDRVVSYRLAERLNARSQAAPCKSFRALGTWSPRGGQPGGGGNSYRCQGIRGRHSIRTPSEPRASGEEVTTQVASVHGAMRPR